MSLFKKLLADSENSTIPWNLSGDKKIWRLIMFCLTCCRFSCLVMKSLSLENGSSSCYPHNLLIFFGPRLPNHSILTAPCIDIFISLLFKTLSVYIQMMMIFVTIDSDLPLSHKKSQFSSLNLDNIIGLASFILLMRQLVTLFQLAGFLV